MRFVAIAAAAVLAACGGGSRAGEPGVDKGGGVYTKSVAPGHMCGVNCGHFWHNEQLYFLDGHVHGGDCGHHKIGGRWTYAKPISGSGCRHDSNCGHYRYHGRWYHVARHIHGSGCGHLYRDGEWRLED